MNLRCVTHSVLYKREGTHIELHLHKGSAHSAGCVLRTMVNPGPLTPGELYDNAATGRQAKSMCQVEEA